MITLEFAITKLSVYIIHVYIKILVLNNLNCLLKSYFSIWRVYIKQKVKINKTNYKIFILKQKQARRYCITFLFFNALLIFLVNSIIIPYFNNKTKEINSFIL